MDPQLGIYLYISKDKYFLVKSPKNFTVEHAHNIVAVLCPEGRHEKFPNFLQR